MNIKYPNLFIVGTQRSGTTSLYEYLRQHPQVFMSPQKETHYFSSDRVRGDSDQIISTESAYLHLFADASGFPVVGEASPSYLWHPEVPQRIYAKQPKAKLIAILRDPVARAFSQYQMDLADGLLPTPFYDLVTNDYHRGEKIYGTGHLYVELGLYLDPLTRYLKTFGAEQLLVLAFNDLTKRPRTVLSEVATFLKIDDDPFDTVDASRGYNQARAPRFEILRNALQYRNMRQRYRALIPPRWRRTLNDWLFVPRPAQTIDAKSKEFLRDIYLPDAAELQAKWGITFPDLSQAERVPA